jgi:hypothetical protein
MHVSILFLMSMPFFIAGSIFGVIYMAHMRAQGQRWPFFLKYRAQHPRQTGGATRRT